MNPAKLQHKISVHANSRVKDELGETNYEFIEIKKIWSAIIPQTGTLQKQEAETILTNVTHKIIIRFNAGKDITKDMQIHFKGHRFEIKYILNPYFNNETLEIFCQELLS